MFAFLKLRKVTASYGQFFYIYSVRITNRIAELLKQNGIPVQIVPHQYDLKESISWVNENFNFGDAWVIEIHRDSANGLALDDASRRCGIYYGTSEGSKEIGNFVCSSLISHGAHTKTWAHPDTASNHKNLGWIRKTKPIAHLLELGFMQGKNDDDHLSWLSKVAAAAIFEAFTGRSLAITH